MNIKKCDKCGEEKQNFNWVDASHEPEFTWSLRTSDKGWDFCSLECAQQWIADELARWERNRLRDEEDMEKARAKSA